MFQRKRCHSRVGGNLQYLRAFLALILDPCLRRDDKHYPAKY
ncbi:hypothetical protein [Candidatus Tisiphia endosymbiont of Hybos culiciformis]